MAERVQLVLADLEGVLTPSGGSRTPMDPLKLLRVRESIVDLPMLFALCTGRPAAYIEPIWQLLGSPRPLPLEQRKRLKESTGQPIEGCPSITQNGAELYDPLTARSFSHPVVSPRGIRLIQRLRWEIMPELAGQLGATIEGGKEYSISLNPPLNTEVELLYHEILSWAEADGYLESLCIKHSKSAVDITLMGVSKAGAVDQLMRWLGIPPEATVGVGDSPGDTDWLNLVGESAAPSNGRSSLPGLKYYSDFAESDGLIDILRQLKATNFTGLTAP